MMDRFKLDQGGAVRVREAPLRRTVAEIFRKMGVPDGDSDLAADVLVTSDLRGVDTHGVSDMVKLYVEEYRSGQTNPRPNWRILRETPATASIDSETGLGIIVAPKAMAIAIEKARNVGVGIVTISNGRHLGMASYHAMLALEHDMIGMCMTSTPPVVVPTFGSEPRLGTNPIAIAVPAESEPPFVLDIAMSAIAAGKITLARRTGRDLPPGSIADENGTPVMKAAPAPELGQDALSVLRLLPLGSTRELGSHKGFGLAAMVDVLAGVLTGGGYGAVPGPPNYGHYVAAYSVEAFMDTGQFKQTMDEWLRMLKSTAPAAGHDRVLYPGLAEAETQADRRANGVPLHPEVIGWFRDICTELSVPFTLTEGQPQMT